MEKFTSNDINLSPNPIYDQDGNVRLFGQEVQPETYAISKADLLLKGEGAAAEWKSS